MKVLNICCTYNRVHCLKRSIKCFIDQTYEGEQILFIFNTGNPIELDTIELPVNKQIILVNSSMQEFNSVGEKYCKALELAPEADIVTSWDDDDIFLPWFNELGVKGFLEAKNEGYLAYKTLYSLYRHEGGVEKMNNVFEPAIFVDYNFIKEHKYLPLNVKYHDGWLQPLLANNKIFVDDKQKPLFIYDWHPSLQVFKLSGGEEGTSRYSTHAFMSNSVLSKNEIKLVPDIDNSYYYNLIKLSN